MSKDLQLLRNEIDCLDKQLWEIIGKRVELAREIGEIKRTHNEPIVQTQRYQQVLDQCLKWGKEKGISEDAVREVMEALHKESVRVQS